MIVLKQPKVALNGAGREVDGVELLLGGCSCCAGSLLVVARWKSFGVSMVAPTQMAQLVLGERSEDTCLPSPS